MGLLVVSGLLLGLGASRLGLPRVVGYVAAGILFSPDLLGQVVPLAEAEWTEPLTTAALGIIAYLIGGSITVDQLRRMGTVIISSAMGESLGAVVAVFLVVFPIALWMNAPTPLLFALALATVAATTAPAATIAVVHQYRAKGPVSATLLGVVAIDDALGIIFFSLMLAATSGQSFGIGLSQAFSEIAGSLVLGAAGGRLLSAATRRVHQRELQVPLVLGVILFLIGGADIGRLSPLLTAMMLGFAARYFLGTAGDQLFAPVEYLEELVFIVFFTLAGVHFQTSIFLQHIALIFGYIAARMSGKITGAFVGAKLSGAPAVVQRWLGPALVPQAGVAVGLILTLGHQPVFREVSRTLLNVILATTMIYELTSPLAVRFALEKAGELGEKR